MDGWLENEFLKKTPSPKSGLESQLGTSDFGVCQFNKFNNINNINKFNKFNNSTIQTNQKIARALRAELGPAQPQLVFYVLFNSAF